MTNTLIDIRPGTYVIDAERSSAVCTATHMFGLKPVHATMPVQSGTVTVAADPDRSTVSAELRADGWASGDARRDKDIRGKRFLDTGRYPVIGFRSTQVRAEAGGRRITGEVGVRGGSAEITLLLTGAEVTVDGYRFTATSRVDRVAVGITGGRPLIGRYVDVALTIVVTAG